MKKQKNYDWKNLLLELTKKEISVRYKKTFFGFLWMFLNPLSQMLILGIVFQYFTNLSIQTENYFLFLFVGLIIWNFFSNTLNTAVPIYVNERALLQKSKFPREIIFASVLFSNLFHYFVSLFVLLCFMALYFLIGSSAKFVIIMLYKFPLIVLTTIWLGLFTSGIGLLLSSLNVKYRDINFFTIALLPLVFYATPIIWEMNLVSNPYLPFLYLNPIASIIEINRYVFLHEDLTFPAGVYFGLLTTVIAVILGNYVFRKESPYFDDWL